MDVRKPPEPAVEEPRDQKYVSLSEALTWMAFRHSLGDEELRREVAGEPLKSGYSDHGFGRFYNRDEGLEQLAGAWEMLRQLVDLDTLKIRGRLTRSYSLREAQPKEPKVLTGECLAGFSQFDISTGGIRRHWPGQPTVLWDGHPLAYEREWESFTGSEDDRDGYLMVEVLREDLMRAAPADRESLCRAFPMAAADPAGLEEAVGRRDSVKSVRQGDMPTRWQFQRPNAQQRQLFAFFEKARQHMPGGSREKSKAGLRLEYNSAISAGKIEGGALGRSAFEKWLDRWKDGWRPSPNGWALPQDAP